MPCRSNFSLTPRRDGAQILADHTRPRADAIRPPAPRTIHRDGNGHTRLRKRACLRESNRAGANTSHDRSATAGRIACGDADTRGHDDSIAHGAPPDFAARNPQFCPFVNIVSGGAPMCAPLAYKSCNRQTSYPSGRTPRGKSRYNPVPRAFRRIVELPKLLPCNQLSVNVIVEHIIVVVAFGEFARSVRHRSTRSTVFDWPHAWLETGRSHRAAVVAAGLPSTLRTARCVRGRCVSIEFPARRRLAAIRPAVIDQFSRAEFGDVLLKLRRRQEFLRFRTRGEFGNGG